MKHKQKQMNKDVNTLKDLIVNNPRVKERIANKEIEREIRKSERRGNKSTTLLYEF